MLHIILTSRLFDHIPLIVAVVKRYRASIVGQGGQEYPRGGEHRFQSELTPSPPETCPLCPWSHY